MNTHKVAVTHSSIKYYAHTLRLLINKADGTEKHAIMAAVQALEWLSMPDTGIHVDNLALPGNAPQWEISNGRATAAEFALRLHQSELSQFRKLRSLIEEMMWDAGSDD